MFNRRIPCVTICLLIILSHALDYTGPTQDQTSMRTNTLYDDADDTQKQLDNEAKDRFKLGRPFWVFHLSTRATSDDNFTNYRANLSYMVRPKRYYNLKDTTPVTTQKAGTSWDYEKQAEWGKTYLSCNGTSQSPVDISIGGLIKTRGLRTLIFYNHDVVPREMTLSNDGKRLVLSGKWPPDRRPMIYGGAAHSRRYLFDSMRFHYPSEHSIEGRKFKIESQLLFVSAEYGSLQEAVNASAADPLALLAIASLYKRANYTQIGLSDILLAAAQPPTGECTSRFTPTALAHFNPPFKKYVSYHGSLTTPPCTEAVLWMIRGKSLPVTDEAVEMASNLFSSQERKQFQFRATQPLNDRKVYLFK